MIKSERNDNDLWFCLPSCLSISLMAVSGMKIVATTRMSGGAADLSELIISFHLPGWLDGALCLCLLIDLRVPSVAIS